VELYRKQGLSGLELPCTNFWYKLKERYVAWRVRVSAKAQKQIKRLPESARFAYLLLAKELEAYGPYRSNWSHYGKLRGKKDLYHCHFVSGRPTYVACWKVKNKKIRLLEIYYVGTHEKAPY
jgi:mRNA-degrading endonuclease RelE of RelBE toxin-antitoxin system